MNSNLEKTTETVHGRIDRIALECQHAGWDGGAGLGIHPLTAKLTHYLADALPDGYPGPSYEGEFEFEWDADGGTYIVDVLFLPHETK